MTSRALGRYELVRPLARGGMAEVFLARRRAGGVEKLLVVKRIRAERVGDARFLELFMREAKLSMSLAHQNIVPVFDFGRAGDQVFLAMERVEGRDLGSTLAHADRKLPSSLIAAFIAAECCQALDYAHRRKNADGTSRGVVHRDVTPRNVLLSWSGEVKLTDFGIASLAGEDTSKLVGTPAYMAPEQARGEAVDVRADVYAVGMVLREALTGARARGGEDRETLLGAARTGTLTPWTEGASDPIDPTLISIADRATAPAPADRYATAQDMLADLDAYIVAERAKKRGDSPARQIAAWLVAVWGDDREEASSGTLDPADDGHLMSFLDEGSAVGTGTERSLAATAADDAEPPKGDAQPAVAAPVSVEAGTTADAAATADPDTTAATVSPAPPGALVVVAPAASRRRAIVAGVVVVGAIAISVLAMRSRDSATTSSGSVVAIVSDAARDPDAGLRGPGVEPDAVAIVEDAPAIDPPVAGSGSSEIVGRSGSSRLGSGSAVRVGSGSSIRAGSGSAVRAGSGSSIRAGSGGVVVRAGSSQGSGSASSGSGSATPPAVVLRKVHINATPWAYFTVDGGPRMQTPKLLELPPGQHRIHFENAVLKVERDITLDVPADRDISYVEPLGN